ncbi:MAG: hypothetical protein NVS3B18_12340 [Candidatus Dormibacteria bacterium]
MFFVHEHRSRTLTGAASAPVRVRADPIRPQAPVAAHEPVASKNPLAAETANNPAPVVAWKLIARVADVLKAEDSYTHVCPGGAVGIMYVPVQVGSVVLTLT